MPYIRSVWLHYIVYKLSFLLITYSVIAETSTGCLLAGSSLGKRGVQAEEVGRQSAQTLLDNLQHGGCVDEYLQDQVRSCLITTLTYL